MLRLVANIDWTEPENAVPSFLIIAGVPLTFSIAAGIGLGVVGYVVVMLARGRWRAVHPLMWVLVPLFLAYLADDGLAANVFSSPGRRGTRAARPARASRARLRVAAGA